MKKVIIFILKLFVIAAILVWVAVVCMDFFRVKKDKKPQFCVYETTHKYSDGTTYECVGVGYKVFKYKRKSISATEFGPIFISERQDASDLK